MATLPGVSVALALESQNFTSGMVRAERNLDRFGRQATTTSRFMGGAFRNQMQNASFQIADFAVQVGSGTSAMRAFAQQAPQLLAGLGPIGAAGGAAVAVIAGLATVLFNSADASAAAKRSADALKDSLAGQAGTVSDLVTRFDELNATQRELAALQAAQTVRELTDALAEQRAQAVGLAEDLELLSSLAPVEGGLPANVSREQIVRIREFAEALEAGTIEAADLAAELDRLASQTDDPRVRELASDMLGSALATEDLREKLEDAERAQAAFADASGRTVRGLEDQATAARRATEAFEALADVELAVSNAPVARARAEVEAFERALVEQERARKRAAEQAARDAEQAAEEQHRFEVRKAQETADRIARIAQDTIRRGNQAARDAVEERLRAQEQMDREIAAQQEAAAREHARLMTLPLETARDDLEAPFQAIAEEILA